MAWLATAFAGLIFFMCASIPSPLGAALAAVAAILSFPPLWRRLAARGHNTRRRLRGWGAACSIAAAFIIGTIAFADSPAGIAAREEREAEAKSKAIADAQTVSEASAAAESKRKSGEHCLSGWDGSFPALKTAVKRSLRNPKSFELIDTVRSPVDGDGTFGVIMTYRAENGFGGMNVETIGVEVDAQTCDFERASATSLARRLANGRANGTP